MTRTRTALLLACGILAYSRGWLDAPQDWFLSRALEPDERTAVELQCRSMDGVLRESCESETTESLVAGEFDPEPILRVHCTRFENRWATGDVEIPPDLCIQRYGGWLHS
jgi:hypothetical protein